MTRGTDTGTDTRPRVPRQAPGRPVPPGRPLPPGRAVPPGRPVLPGRAVPPGRAALPPSRTMPPRRAEPPRGRTDPRARPLSAPRHTRPLAGSTGAGSGPAIRRPAGPAAGLRPRIRHPRAPFILLLVGLLGGALISMLVISTTLAQGSFRISNLQQQDTNLARQEQLLTQEVAQAESPAQIAQEAEQFGMQQNPDLRFIDLKTGKIVTGKVSQADAQINVPGYTP
jgi:hypothetical protein